MSVHNKHTPWRHLAPIPGVGAPSAHTCHPTRAASGGGGRKKKGWWVPATILRRTFARGHSQLTETNP